MWRPMLIELYLKILQQDTVEVKQSEEEKSKKKEVCDGI